MQRKRPNGRRPASKEDRALALRIGERVRKLRGDESLRAFAARADIAPMTLHAVERGSPSTVPTLNRIARALGVRLEELAS